MGTPGQFRRRLSRVFATAILFAATLTLFLAPDTTAITANLPYHLEPAMTSSVGTGQQGLVADGEVAVWEDTRSGDPDIYAYDIQDNREFRPAPTDGYRIQPAISGSTIIWVSGKEPDERTIEGIDLIRNVPVTVTSEPGEVSDPAISGTTVVWRERRDGQWVIAGKNLNSGKEFQASDQAAKNPAYPSISENTVVWQDYRNGNWDPYQYDTKSGTVRPLIETPDDETNPVIRENMVAFYRVRTNGGSPQLILYNRDARSQKVITSDHTVAHPAIGNGIITWEDWRSGLPDIYAYDIDHDEEFAVARSQQAFDPAVLQGGIAWINRSGPVKSRIQALAMVKRLPTDRQDPPAVPSPDRLYVSETQHFMSTGFKSYWQTHGGPSLFGFPLTEEFFEKDPASDGDIIVQYFERVKLEYRGSLPEGERISLGRLGVELTESRQFAPVAAFTSSDDRLYFPETQHSLASGFKQFWDANGGLASFGFPISEEFQENGRTVQYFERARFEFNPDGADTQSKVILGLLGREALQQKGWLPAPPLDTTHLVE